MTDAPLTSGTSEMDDGTLTAREAEICQWIAEGKSNKEIALILDISHRTVEKHMEKILKKQHVDSRMQLLVRLLAESGDLPPK